MNNLEDLYRRGKDLLQKIPNNHIDTRLILLDCFDLSNEDFIKNPELEPSRKDIKRYFHMIGKRRKGYPLSYLIGIKEFWSIPFFVKKGVFIPRPETELIIETVLALNSVEKPNIVDIGTGSGNIAVCLAKEIPGAKIFATDISKKALWTAQKNAGMQGVEKIQFFLGDLFEPLKKKGLNDKFDFILSNPPYVSREEWKTLPKEIRLYEPKNSLVSGESGLNFFQKMISSAFIFLKPGGHLVFEIGYGQKEKILDLFKGQWKEIKCYDDLSGIPRVVSAEKGWS